MRLSDLLRTIKEVSDASKAVTFLLHVFSANLQAASFTVMTYNLENLFDTVHDKDKLDWPYLPKNKRELVSRPSSVRSSTVFGKKSVKN